MVDPRDVAMLTVTLDKVGTTLAGAARGLQVNLDTLGSNATAVVVGLQDKVERSSDTLSTAIHRASGHLVQSLDQAAEAARDAAAASEKHARSLARATWALVAATFALVLVAVLQLWHH